MKRHQVQGNHQANITKVSKQTSPRSPNKLHQGLQTNFTKVSKQINIYKRQDIHNLQCSAILNISKNLNPEIDILRQVHAHIEEVFSTLLQKKHLPKGHLLAHMDLTADDQGVITIRSKVWDISHAFLPKALISLSLSSGLTTLFIKSAHYSLWHPGISALLSILANSYYIPGLWNQLEKVSRECAFCESVYLMQCMGLQLITCNTRHSA